MHAIVAGIFIGVVSTVLAAWIYDSWKSRRSVRVRRIKRSSDRDVQGFIDLYEDLIGDALRIESSEIVRWIDEDNALRAVQSNTYHHYLLVGKVGKTPVSFLKAMYCSECRYLFIAYYGVDASDRYARSLAAAAMMEKVVGLVKKEIRECKGVLYEAEAPIQRLKKEEKARRTARIRLFKDTAKRLGYMTFSVGIDYRQPQMVVAPQGKFAEEKMVLLYTPLGTSTAPENKQLNKKAVMDILSFVYLRIYGPTFRHEPEKNLAYQRYLGSLLERYEHDLPNAVPLVE